MSKYLIIEVSVSYIPCTNFYDGDSDGDYIVYEKHVLAVYDSLDEARIKVGTMKFLRYSASMYILECPAHGGLFSSTTRIDVDIQDDTELKARVYDTIIENWDTVSCTGDRLVKLMHHARHTGTFAQWVAARQQELDDAAATERERLRIYHENEYTHKLNKELVKVRHIMDFKNRIRALDLSPDRVEEAHTLATVCQDPELLDWYVRSLKPE